MLDIQHYHHAWLEKNYPIVSSKKNLENESVFRCFRRSQVFQFLKRLLPYTVKEGVKSISRIPDLFGYIVTGGEKRVALTYVEYIAKHAPVIDESIFSGNSVEEIYLILNNEFHFSYKSYVNLNNLYQGKKMEEFKEAQKFHRKAITKKGDFYEYNGFKTVIPNFEYSVLKNNCGLDHLPLKVQQRLQGTLFIDCGAFSGDSAFIFQKLFPGTTLALEPDPENLVILNKNIALNNMKHVIPICAGVGEKSKKVGFTSEGIWGYVSEKGGDQEIDLVTIDELALEYKQTVVGLIKMDIEGYEMNALKGAVEVIKNDKPVLLIALYHSGKDFFEIPSYVKKINPDYTMHIVSTNPLTPLYEKYLIAY